MKVDRRDPRDIITAAATAEGLTIHSAGDKNLELEALRMRANDSFGLTSILDHIITLSSENSDAGRGMMSALHTLEGNLITRKYTSSFVDGLFVIYADQGSRSTPQTSILAASFGHIYLSARGKIECADFYLVRPPLDRVVNDLLLYRCYPICETTEEVATAITQFIFTPPFRLDLKQARNANGYNLSQEGSAIYHRFSAAFALGN